MRYILTLPTLLVLLCGCISNGSDAVGPSPHGAVPGDGQGERDGKRYSIHGKKDIIDDVTGKVVESYDLQLDFDRDINEIVRQANNRANLGKKVKCHVRLKHSELSDVLDKIIWVFFRMRKRHLLPALHDGMQGDEDGMQTCERPPLWAFGWPRGGVHMFTSLHVACLARVA